MVCIAISSVLENNVYSAIRVVGFTDVNQINLFDGGVHLRHPGWFSVSLHQLQREGS